MLDLIIYIYNSSVYMLSLSNALKFTQHGHVHVHLEKIGPAISAPTSPLGELDMFNENRNMQALQFTVKDTGTGIPKNKLDLLFQTFYQVDALTTRNCGGTGLAQSTIFH